MTSNGKSLSYLVRILKDLDMIEVDAEKGIVRIIERA